MKLLFDQNLSYKLCQQLADLFPGSTQVRLQQLDQADDLKVWSYAKMNGFLVVTQDSDYADMAVLFGPPPKVIWLRGGNRPTSEIEALLRQHAGEINALAQDNQASCLELY